MAWSNIVGWCINCGMLFVLDGLGKVVGGQGKVKGRQWKDKGRQRKDKGRQWKGQGKAVDRSRNGFLSFTSARGRYLFTPMSGLKVTLHKKRPTASDESGAAERKRKRPAKEMTRR